MSDNLQDSSHFYRIISLVVDVGTETLIETFYQKIPRADVQPFFISRHPTFNLLKQRKILNPAQFELVTASNPDPNLFDISLLITLLRNICPDVEPPLCTWEKPPPDSSDTTLGAELLRLKDIRNRVTAHGTKAQMGREEFQEFWMDIERILLSIAGNISPSYADKVKKKISDLKVGQLEPQGDCEKRMLALFKKWQEDEKEGLKEQLKEDLTSIQESLQSLHLKVDAKDAPDAAHGDTNNPDIHSIQEQVSRIENDLRTIATQESVEEVCAHIKNGEDVQGKIMKKMETFHKEIQEIKKLLGDFFAKQHGGQGSTLQTDSARGYPQQQGPWNGYQPIGAQHDQSLGNPYNGIPLMSGQFTGIQPMSGQYSGYTGIQPVSAQLSAIQPMSSQHVQPISPRQTNEMSEKELRTLSGEIGLEWEEVGTFLDFKRKQIERLKLIYPHQVQGCIFTMLQKWHDVAACFGENPRLLLAGVFIELKNRQLASKIVSRDLLDDASRYRVNPSTVAAIQSINFDIVPPPQYLHQQYGPGYLQGALYPAPPAVMGASQQMAANHQVGANQQTIANQQVSITANHGVLKAGAAGAINVFGGELNIGGSMVVDGSGGTVPIQQSFSSSDLYKTALDRSYTRLVRDLSPRRILDRFFKIGFLPYTTIRDIQELPKSSDKNRTIIDHVMRKCPDGYITFKRCLNDIHQGDLADSLTGLENKLKQEIYGEKHSSLPLEIRRMDERSIEIYKHALATGEEPDHSIRVMVVGHSGVGKTTLTKRLLDEDVDLSENKSTDGIEIHQRKCRVNLENGDWTKLRKDEISENYKTRQRLVLNKHLKDDSKPNELQKENEALTSSINDTDDGSKNTETEIVYKRINENKETEIDKKNEVSQQADDRVSETLRKSGQNEGKKNLEEVIASDAPILENTAELSIWDFAGQYVYYCTHHIFLSRRAIYLLVTDITEDIDSVVNDDDDDTSSVNDTVLKLLSEYIQFWLNSIHCNRYTPDTRIVPSVLLVGTHAGERKDKVNAHFISIRKLLKDEKTEKHIVKGSFPVENEKKEPRHEELKRKIVEVAKQQSYWGQPIPCRWVKLEQKLDTMRDKGYKIIKRTLLDEINATLFVPLEQEELGVFLEFHDSCGNLVYYKNEPLNENILLDPQWLVDALKCLISSKKFIEEHELYVKWDDAREKGCLTDAVIDRIWKHTDEENKKEKEKNNEQRDENKIESFYENRNYLICLLETFNIIAKPKMDMTLTDTKPEEDNFYFVPCLLVGSSQKKLTMEIVAGGCKTTSTLCFKGPANISIHAIYCKLLSSYIKKFKLAKCGKKYLISSDCGIFYLGDSKTYRLAIRLSASRDRAIQLTVSSRNQSAFDLSRSQRASESVLKYLSGGDFKEFVLCPTCKIEIDVEKLRDIPDDENYFCDERDDGGHELKPRELLKYWYEGKKHEQKPQVEDADQSDVRFCSDNKYKKSTDDTLSETVTNAFAEHMKSVGALVYSNGIGTVFRVGSKYVMTAWHVVDNIVDPSRKGDQDYSKLEETNVFIIFDEDPMQCTSKYYVKKNPAFIDKMLDISVLEINSVNNQPNLPKRLHLRKEGPIEDRHISDISLVGYGHPGSNKKHLDPKCRVISQLSNSAVPAALGWLKKYRDYYVDALKSAGKDHSLVDTAYTGYDVQSKLLLNCYMEHGASGAPTFTTVNPTALSVVGVLTKGLPEFFFYLPKMVQTSFPPERRFEMAARMTHIYKSMCEKNAALAKDLFETG